MESKDTCPKCGEKENLHFNYNYNYIHLPIESILCNECGEIFKENESEQTEFHSPYCPVCTGCGEEGCCSPIKCQQSPVGTYCKTYLYDLKFAYMMNDEIMKKIYEDKEKNKDLIDFIDNIYDTMYEKVYKK